MSMSSGTTGGPCTGIETIRPDGHLTEDRTAAFKRDVRRHLRAGRDVILDLSSVTFADSEGLSALVALFRSASEVSRRFVLCAPPLNLRALLELTRLHRVFEIFEDRSVAVAELQGAGG